MIYHLRHTYNEALSIPIHMRKWLIHRLVEQKNKEKEEMEKSSKKR